jgi:hypothetical protein
MQSTAWELLLRQFPPEQHGALMLSTTAGVAITIQGILRLDHEFLAIRGRLAGSTDSNRLFVIPYQHIEYLGTQGACNEADFHARFDGVKFPAAASAPPASPAPAPAAEPAPAPDAAVSAPAEPEVGPAPRTPPPIKSAVLERFRARTGLSSGAGSQRPSNG